MEHVRLEVVEAPKTWPSPAACASLWRQQSVSATTHRRWSPGVNEELHHVGSSVSEGDRGSHFAAAS